MKKGEEMIWVYVYRCGWASSRAVIPLYPGLLRRRRPEKKPLPVYICETLRRRCQQELLYQNDRNHAWAPPNGSGPKMRFEELSCIPQQNWPERN